MKSMLVIGLGDFGHHLCRHLLQMKNEILAVDKSEEAMEDLEDVVSSRLIADCTSKNTLERLGVSNFDICFVCIGGDFKNNLIIVSLLKELGAKYVVSETDDEMLGRLLLSNGADEIVHPNKDSARRVAVKYSSEYIFDYLKLKGGYSIYEVSPLRAWVGKSILESRIRELYETYIISVIGENEETNVMPSPDTVIRSTDRLMVLTHEETMKRLLREMEK